MADAHLPRIAGLFGMPARFWTGEEMGLWFYLV